MNRKLDDISGGVDDGTERLISRALDGELHGAAFEAFAERLESDEAFRSLYASSQSIDALASAALRAEMDAAAAAPTGEVRRPVHRNGHACMDRLRDAKSAWWSWTPARVAAAAATCAAAAVLVLATIMLPPVGSGLGHDSGSGVVGDALPPGRAAMPIDYRTPVYQPMRLRGDVFRDVIGIQGDDPDMLLIFEREMRAASVETVTSEI